jgi:hypothetical protein
VSFDPGLPGCVSGNSMDWRIRKALLVLSASWKMAKPKDLGLSEPSIARLHSFNFPSDYQTTLTFIRKWKEGDTLTIRSIHSSEISSGIPPMKTEWRISSVLGGSRGPSGCATGFAMGVASIEGCGVEIVVAPERVWPK